jgi:hypothetical protein
MDNINKLTPNKNFLKFNNTSLVIIGIVLIIIISIIFYNLYEESREDSHGNKLSIKDTLKNMCGIYPLIHRTLKKSVSLVKSTTSSLANKLTLKRKEVFNIDNNAFTYNQAKKVCKAYSGTLATYNQIASAHRRGANWCNYGWSANNMALYPIQSGFHKSIQSNPKTKGNCGKPGINGGRFKDMNIKFGVNCYGYRPDANESQLVYNTDPIYKRILEEEKKKKTDLHKYKDLVKKNVIEIRPFNNEKWSKYSHKKSTYILSPKDPLNLIIEETLDDNEKDPRNIKKPSKPISSKPVSSKPVVSNKVIKSGITSKKDKKKKMMIRMFKKIDTNNDTYISKAEALKFYTADMKRKGAATFLKGKSESQIKEIVGKNFTMLWTFAIRDLKLPPDSTKVPFDAFIKKLNSN